MRKTGSALSLLAALLLLSGCAQFERNAPQAAVDDDAICRAQGEPGSAPYVACRKDRDVSATREGRIERAHRNLAEDMLNNRR
jgi:PBP1b-binding outer membrane lipoprotein LpoB